jgi:hypothetical protein
MCPSIADSLDSLEETTTFAGAAGARASTISAHNACRLLDNYAPLSKIATDTSTRSGAFKRNRRAYGKSTLSIVAGGVKRTGTRGADVC